MKLEGTWSASSKSEDIRRGDELTNMVGQWDAGINVGINLPYTYSKGPIISNRVNYK